MVTEMETQLRPARAVAPGNIVRRELEARGWTQKDFAEIIGRPVQVVNEIVAGKKSITPETARLFAAAFGTSAKLWLNLESSYRLRLLETTEIDEVEQRAALHNAAPVKELVKKGWVEFTTDVSELSRRVAFFFGVSDLDGIVKAAANLNPSMRLSTNHVPDAISLFAWLRRAEIVASRMAVAAYSAERLSEAAPHLRRLSRSAQQLQAVREALAGIGVRLVIVPHLTRTYVDGAAFWLDPSSPVVALSLRYKRLDNFWFTLMHEIAHILLHSTAGTVVDVDLEPASEDLREAEANARAADWLISSEEYKVFTSACTPPISRRCVPATRQYAEQLCIDPGILVGRIHYEQNDYKLMTHMIRNVCENDELEQINLAA